jgi:CHAT domain-containing protein/Tfp pilus assembly protein PilF
MTWQIEFWRSPRRGQKLRAVGGGLTLAVSMLLGSGLAAVAEPRPVLQRVVQPAQERVDSHNTAQGEQDLRTLELGKPVERELAGGQTHTYELRLAAGQYFEVVVEQRGIDVVAALFGPDGKRLTEVDGPNGARGPETVWWVAEVDGSYRLEIRSLRKDAAAGRYEVRIEALRAATEGDRALAEALRLHSESEGLREKGKYSEAIPLAERALKIREKVLGPEHLDVATSLNGLAGLHHNKEDYAKAEPLYQRALAIWEKAFGHEHPDVALSLNNLAALYRARGDYAKAELLYQRALAIREKALGPEHLDVAQTLNNLARLYRARGDYAKAEPLFHRSLAILEKVLGPEHPLVAIPLNNLAGLYQDKGDYAKAEPLFHRSLAIREKVLGPEHPAVATLLNNVALLYHIMGDYAKAEAPFQRALAILEKVLGPEKPGVAIALHNLAVLYRARGDYAKAEPLFHRSLAIREKTLGPEHPNVAQSLHNLALLYRAKGETQQAVSFLTRSNEVRERNLIRTLLIGSERQKLIYLGLFAPEVNSTLSLHAQSAPDDPQALRLALTTLLRRKGRTLDNMTDTITALRRRASPQGQALLNQLSDVHSQLAALTLRGPGTSNPTSYRSQLKQLEDQAEEIEAEISAHSSEFRTQVQPITLEVVQAAIPDGAALVEFASYTPLDAKAKSWGPSRYLAYVLTPRGQPTWADLGEAASIDRAVDALLQALRDPRRSDVRRLARSVDEKVMSPVRALLGEARRVLVSPDGPLNLVPFAALVDERNEYLIERYSFSYLTSGRDLLRLQIPRQSKGGPLVVADPAYGEPAGADLLADQSREPTQAGGQSVSAQGGSARVYFRPLPGTAEEAQALKRLLPQAVVLTREQATEAALKRANAPSLLHVATHGLFLKDLEDKPVDARDLDVLGGGPSATSELRLSRWAAHIENPLLRSGLALAGANRQQSGDEDGVLTALEAAGLDLWGTKLVVLSACNTGVGEVKNGEGVYGLRRALVLAGSESQVMSLWAVKDKVTRDLMIGYYTGLQQGQGRGEALRNVQLRMLRSKNRRHPYYWASFIHSGEWANMEGKR